MCIKLVPPCSYQGGKQRLAKQIVGIILKQNEINEDTKFYDLCCGSGAITLELINRGINPSNITMIDLSTWGLFWESIGNNTFDKNVFKKYLNDIPSDITKIKEYAKLLLSKPCNEGKINDEIYKFLILQSCAFGGTATWIENNAWKKAGGLRNYWLPTQTSNRRSPVNPMMPMPKGLYERIENIVDCLNGKIIGINGDISNIEWKFDKNSIIYIDPPYKNTQTYGFDFNYENFIEKHKLISSIYISEGYEMIDANERILLSKGRTKGNINGNIKKKPTEEWLNIYKT